MIISGFVANKMHFRSTFCLQRKLNGPFQLHCVTLYFYDVNITISPLDRPITAKFTKGFP